MHKAFARLMFDLRDMNAPESNIGLFVALDTNE